MTSNAKSDVRYWRSAYEELVRQTGRDLNDGYGLCKCRPVPSVFASAPPPPAEAPALGVDRDTLKYAQQLATVAAQKVGCVEGWRPLNDVYGCLTQIDNALTGLTAHDRP